MERLVHMARRSELPLSNEEFERGTQQLAAAAVLSLAVTIGQIASQSINANTTVEVIESAVRENFEHALDYLKKVTK
jgi:hypothetical protein